MVLLNEWLPNPQGSDVDGEWIELRNDASSVVALNGWHIETSAGKKFYLENRVVPPGGYLLLRRSETHLVLKNSNERIVVYDSTDRVVGASFFVGTAEEGKSYANTGGKYFWSDPTPGTENSMPKPVAILGGVYSMGQPLAKPHGSSDFILLGFLIGALIATLVLIAIKNHAILSELFFDGNEKIR